MDSPTLFLTSKKNTYKGIRLPKHSLFGKSYLRGEKNTFFN